MDKIRMNVLNKSIPSTSKKKQPIFNIPTIILIIIFVCFFLHCIRNYFLTEEQNMFLILYGSFIPLRYDSTYAWGYFSSFSSPFTCFFFHANYTHLFMNMAWLAAVGTPLVGKIGTIRFILFCTLTHIAGVATHYFLHPHDPSPLLGASGAIAGMMALPPLFLFHVKQKSGLPTYVGEPLSWRDALRNRYVLIFFLSWLGLNFLIGFLGIPGISDSIAWEAHLGGFIAGFLLFPFLNQTKKY